MSDMHISTSPDRQSPQVHQRHARHASKLAAAIAGLGLLLSLTSCAQTVPAPAKPASSTEEPASAQLSRELKVMVGEAPCSQNNQCHSLAVGAKACGGPTGYLAWSSQTTDSKKLLALAKRQTDAQRREVELSGMASDCRMNTDPGAMCIAGRCQLSVGSGANAAR